jgi:UDP-glucose 4-epimerase
MKRRVLVTGGTGLVGAPVVRRLIAAGWSVLVLSRHPPVDASQEIEWVRGDLTADPQGVLHALQSVDAVVHAAAAVYDGGDVPSMSLLADTNIRGSDAVFRWCADRKVRRVILIGSLSVLRRPLSVPIDESHPVGPTSPYAMSKLWNEQQLHRYSVEGGFTPIVLRVSSPVPLSYDAMPRTVVKIWLDAALRGDPIRVYGSGSRSQDFVSCEDIAEAVCRSLDSPSANGIYHIGSGVALNMRELAHAIAEVRRTPIEISGIDPNEDDRWQLSLARANKDLAYSPKRSGLDAIRKLARSVL